MVVLALRKMTDDATKACGCGNKLDVLGEQSLNLNLKARPFGSFSSDKLKGIFSLDHFLDPRVSELSPCAGLWQEKWAELAN